MLGAELCKCLLVAIQGGLKLLQRSFKVLGAHVLLKLLVLIETTLPKLIHTSFASHVFPQLRNLPAQTLGTRVAIANFLIDVAQLSLQFATMVHKLGIKCEYSSAALRNLICFASNVLVSRSCLL